MGLPNIECCFIADPILREKEVMMMMILVLLSLTEI